MQTHTLSYFIYFEHRPQLSNMAAASADACSLTRVTVTDTSAADPVPTQSSVMSAAPFQESCQDVGGEGF